ncbi:MAG TPA: Sapep family Mn(2+)-dependent dipeptidase, partial [Anaerovoracaceae bacterium]|nr:Sapep family Mn(2+)-dependent dipeptidase [Anaerovoracaceae bacterium]
MEYLDLIDEYQGEIIKTLQELISIRSVQSEAVKGNPFGNGVQEAFEYMLEKGKKEGFNVINIDNYGGHIEFGEDIGNNNDIMGILGHLDVVPEGKDWDFKPYSGELIDGKIYGRGAIDDKGPLVACLYAMKALKDTGVILNKKVRLILGLDEETEWNGMDYYLKKVEAPDFGFTPDCDFPIVRGEMGVLIFKVTKEIKETSHYREGVTIKSIVGGNAANVVADYASAVVKADSYTEIIDKLLVFKKETGYMMHTKIIDETLEITANGISSHGARPEFGLNAISILMKFLSQLIINNEDICNFIDFYNSHIGFELG